MWSLHLLWGTVATPSLHPVLAVGELPDPWERKEPSSSFPSSWEGTEHTLLVVSKTGFPAVASWVRAEAHGISSGFYFSPDTPREGAPAPAQVTHGALARWRGRLGGAVGQKGCSCRGRWFSALGGEQEQRGAFFTFSRAEAKGVRNWRGCDLRAVGHRRTFTVSSKWWKRKEGNCEVGEGSGCVRGDLNADRLVCL